MSESSDMSDMHKKFDYKKVGEILAETRKSKNISLDEAADKTKIRKVFLIAIEESNYSELPESVYACGFVRSYAKMLDLDYVTLSENFKVESASGIVSSSMKTVLEPEDEMESSLPDKKTVAAVLFIIALAYAGWTFFEKTKEKKIEPPPAEETATVVNEVYTGDMDYYPTADTVPEIGGQNMGVADNAANNSADNGAEIASSTSETETKDTMKAKEGEISSVGNSVKIIPVENVQKTGPEQTLVSVKEEAFIEEEPENAEEAIVKSDNAAPVSYGSKDGDSRVVLEALKEVWVQVENDTKILFSRILAKGDKYFVPNGDSTLKLRAGNSDALAVYVDGKKIAPLAKKSTVLRNVSIDADALLARDM